MTRNRDLESRAWRELRLLVLDRDGWRCQLCGGPATEVDHVIARADGGPVHDPANLRASCKPCNGRRSAQRTNSYRYRNTVARFETRY